MDTGRQRFPGSVGSPLRNWIALFAKLALKKLTLQGRQLETLRCFAAVPITLSMQELTIEGGALPPSELPHLFGLVRLRTLRLDYCFSPRLDDATSTA